MKKILICNLYKHYTINSIVKAFSELGCAVCIKDYFTPADKYHDAKLEMMLANDISAVKYDFIFTVNYSPIIADICYNHNVTYVSWTYDTPMDLYSTDTMDNPTNLIFIFDNGEYQKYKNIGLDTVYYLPLASDFFSLKSSINEYKYDISFIGNLYKATYPKIKDMLDDYKIGYLDGIIAAQRGIYGSYFVLDLLKDQISTVNEINNDTKLTLLPEQLSYSMAAYMTYLDRLSLLSVMSKRYKTAFATGAVDKGEKSILGKVIHLPKMDYYREMPDLFRCSRINLNPPFRAVWSAIPQRALDIMSCGGFLLSGFTQELSYYFKDGEELVLYDSIEDAVSKADFYLKHDDLRKKICSAGYARVKADFNYKERVSTILRFVDGDR